MRTEDDMKQGEALEGLPGHSQKRKAFEMEDSAMSGARILGLAVHLNIARRVLIHGPHVPSCGYTVAMGSSRGSVF